ncbi:PHP domain-containing protein [Bengtsoniella intestinalis]|uniref:PHP domain-containing protein n=1 Tax=Bengtsoniella intestinalis TaxID=3073143 RepID=UPI00391F5198
MISSLHTHATLCDGADSLVDMAKAAYGAGVDVYGVSCHSHTPAPFDAGHTLELDLSAYREQVETMRLCYKDKMDVLLGLEWDATSDMASQELETLDYWIGSVHNLCDPKTNTYHAIDWDGQKLQHCIDTVFAGSALMLVAAYYRMVCQVARKNPPILGHFDLIVKLNENGRFFNENSLIYQNIALDALETVDVEATVLEVNSGALSKYGRIYPAPFILQAWQKRGGRIVLTADAHSASAIIAGMADGAALAQSCGFTHHHVLTNAGWRSLPLV